MVKGISKQVIVVDAPEPKLFEQAIFILKENAVNQEGITDEALMKEAKQLLRCHNRESRQSKIPGPAWACAGAAMTALAWLLSVFL